MNVTEQFKQAIEDYYYAVYLLNVHYVGPVEIGVSADEQRIDNEWAIDVLSQFVGKPISDETPLDKVDEMLAAISNVEVVDDFVVGDNVAVASFDNGEHLYLKNNS